jgi:hypothetical protein
MIKGDNPIKLQIIRFEKFNSLLNNSTRIAEVNFYSLRLISEVGDDLHLMFVTFSPNTEGNLALELILKTYQNLFKEPRGLPPPRLQDHSTPLKDEINLRLYKHFRLQKDVVKKMVSEMLEYRIIQPSYSFFASLIVLMKKRDNSWRLCVDYKA